MGVSRYNKLYRDSGEESVAAGCVTIQHSQGCDTTRARAWDAIQFLYRHQDEACDTRSLCARHGHDTAGHRRDTAMIRPVLGHDTAPLRTTTRCSARAVGAQCEQPRRTMRATKVQCVHTMYLT